MDPEEILAMLPPWAQRGFSVFNHYTRGTNWYRMMFIFLPAIIRGDLASITLYLPFFFGYFLKRSVEQWQHLFSMKDNIKVNMKIMRADYIKWAYKMSFELVLIITFLAFCWYMKTETRFLCNFFLSSFVVPMIRCCFPQKCRGPLNKGHRLWDTTWGDFLVHVFIFVGLSFSWTIQAIPTIQDRFWTKPEQHAIVLFVILGLCLPFFSLGLTSKFFPSYLDYYPRQYLAGLCWLANATPRVTDYYSVLGVSHDADAKTIKRVFREMSVTLHPDKVGDDPVLLARFHAIREASDALTKGRAEYDKAIENQELNEIAPRCEAFLIMMYFWLLHALMDWVQIDGMIESTKKELKKYILNDRNIDFRALGLDHNDEGRKELKEFLETKKAEDLPALQVNGQYPHGNRDDIMALRSMLTTNKIHIGPYPLVTGKVAALEQQLCIRKLDSGAELATEEAAYAGWTATVSGIDVSTNELKTATTEVVRSEVMFKQRVLTLGPALPFEPEMGASQITLSPPAGSSAKAITAEVWFHVYRSRLQVIRLGEEKEDAQYDWKLAEDRNAYTHYKFELWDGDTLLGFQRVHEYLPQHKTVILRGPLVLTGAGRPEERPGMVFKLYPDQFIFPNDMNSPLELTLKEEAKAAKHPAKGKAGG